MRSTSTRRFFRTHARALLCGHLGLNVNNSRIYGPIFFKIYTLILIAILRYHIKIHCICFSRFVFIQFLIRSLFEKKITCNGFLGLSLTVDISCYFYPILFKFQTLILKTFLRSHIKNERDCFSRYALIRFFRNSIFDKNRNFLYTVNISL